MIRPYASAANPALFSTRRPMYRSEERRSASNMPSACWPGSPKTVVAPSPARVSTTRSPPLRPHGRIQSSGGLRLSRPEHQVVVVSHFARASAICRDMIVVSSYAVWDAATDVISA